jgi:hypothetical protein
MVSYRDKLRQFTKEALISIIIRRDEEIYNLKVDRYLW